MKKDNFTTTQSTHVIFDVGNTWWSSHTIKGWHSTEFSITALRELCIVGDENLP